MFREIKDLWNGGSYTGLLEATKENTSGAFWNPLNWFKKHERGEEMAIKTLRYQNHSDVVAKSGVLRNKKHLTSEKGPQNQEEQGVGSNRKASGDSKMMLLGVEQGQWLGSWGIKNQKAGPWILGKKYY